MGGGVGSGGRDLVSLVDSGFGVGYLLFFVFLGWVRCGDLGFLVGGVYVLSWFFFGFFCGVRLGWGVEGFFFVLYSYL